MLSHLQNVDDRKGRLRFQSKEHADKLLAQCDEERKCQFELDNNDGTLTLKLATLTGDEEAEAWRTFRAAMKEKDQQGGSNKRPHGGGGGRGSAKRGRS